MTTIRLRRGTADQWSSANTVLTAGEPGFETDTGLFKVGDGSTAWQALPYVNKAVLDKTYAPATDSSAYAPRSAPAYAPAGLAGRFDPVRSVYNWKASNTRRLRAAISAAVAGVRSAEFVSIGDSLSAGFYDGSQPTNDATAWPRAMAAQLASLVGCPVRGTGVVPATAGVKTNQISDRWALTGGFAAAPGSPAGFLGSYGWGVTSTATFTSQQAGTGVVLFYSDVSDPFSYTVDGGDPIAVRPGGARAISTATTTGLADGTHVVQVTADAGTSVAVSGIAVTSGANDPAGITMHNLAQGSSTAATGDDTTSWTFGAQTWTSLQSLRLGMLTKLAVAPDCVFLALGTNDLAAGGSPADVTSGLSSLRALYPDADAVLVHCWQASTDPSGGNSPRYNAAKYALADTLDVPLVDWNDRLGGVATAQADGALGTDRLHPQQATSVGFGKAVAQLLAA